MRCSIHQPNYIPYLWLFNKIYLSDIFVFYDNAQFTKGDYHNRNKVKWANGEVLLSLPVKVSLGQKINEVSFDNKILRKHWTTIEQSYKKAPYFNTYREEIRRKIYETEETNIAKFNIETIIFLSRLIGIERTSFITLSEILPDLEHSSTKALVDICKEIWSDFYISWAWGRWYVEADLFSDAKIELVFQEYKHPVYSQLWGDFLPYMSILDLIFNEWPNSLSFISQNSIWKI